MKIVFSDNRKTHYQVNRMEELGKTTKCFCNNNLLIIINKSETNYNARVNFKQNDTYFDSAYIGKNQKDVERGCIWIESLEIFTDGMKLLKSFY